MQYEEHSGGDLSCQITARGPGFYTSTGPQGWNQNGRGKFEQHGGEFALLICKESTLIATSGA